METSGCHGQDNEVNYLEHVQVYLDMDYSDRGGVEIYLTSPNGKREREGEEESRDLD